MENLCQVSNTMDCSSPSTPPTASSFHSAHNSRMPKDYLLNVSPRISQDMNLRYHLETPPLHKITNCWDLMKEQSCESSTFLSDGKTTQKSSAELVKEISALEGEIVHVERYLLSLYRTVLQRHLPNINNGTHLQQMTQTSTLDQPSQKEKLGMIEDYSDHQCRISPTNALTGLNDLVQVCTPKSSSEKKHVYSQHRSLADHLGNSCIDDAQICPDRLSEDIIRCITSIYCKLANPIPTQKGHSVSSTSSFCSSTTFSPRNLSGSWSSQCNDEVTEHCDFGDLKQKNGPYASMVEVRRIFLDDESYSYAATMLQKFRCLVKSLEIVDPNKMRREEKLAFWINIHNALVMHAYLAYGTQSYMKSISIVKAAYNVGGHCINAYDIQNAILGIRSHYSASWLQTFLSPGKKFKTGTITKHVYAIEYPEPLVHFALSSGAYSDPAVRVYTANNVFQDLKVAKDEFIQATVYIHKEIKIYLPKILCYYAKDMSLNMATLLETVSESLSGIQQKAIRTCNRGPPEKYVYWLEQSSSFRYLIHEEMAERIYGA